MHKIKKGNGKLHLQISLDKYEVAERQKELRFRITRSKAREILVEAGHSPGELLNDLFEVRNDLYGRPSEGVFVFEDKSFKKPAVKKPAESTQKKVVTKKSSKKEE